MQRKQVWYSFARGGREDLTSRCRFSAANSDACVTTLLTTCVRANMRHCTLDIYTQTRVDDAAEFPTPNSQQLALFKKYIQNDLHYYNKTENHYINTPFKVYSQDLHAVDRLQMVQLFFRPGQLA